MASASGLASCIESDKMKWYPLYCNREEATISKGLGNAMGNELHHVDVRRVGDAGSSPASGFGIGNFSKSWRELIQPQV